MYAQGDTQRVREFYYGGNPPYEDFEKYWNVSPLKYIRNAKTPTLIYVVDGDPRVNSRYPLLGRYYLRIEHPAIIVFAARADKCFASNRNPQPTKLGTRVDK